MPELKTPEQFWREKQQSIYLAVAVMALGGAVAPIYGVMEGALLIVVGLFMLVLVMGAADLDYQEYKRRGWIKTPESHSKTEEVGGSSD